MKYIPVFLLLFALSCKKEDNPKKDFGCVFGTEKETGEYVFIKCTHKLMAAANYNQAAADKVAEKYNLPKENVAYMEGFVNTKFIPNPECSCN
ncbi:MAG TPA: hypothetical protein PK339_12685 [Flavitalea sp.]|nr:hypothetical protein [Flavitalea sp.]